MMSGEALMADISGTRTTVDEKAEAEEEAAADTAAMDVDAGAKSSADRKPKHRIQKRKKVSKIVFPKWGEKNSTKRRKH